MNKFVALFCVTMLAPCASQAQAPIVLCGVTEYCWCDDGTQNTPGLAFALCPDTLGWHSIAIVFCSGDLGPGWVLRGYTGVDDTGQPIPNMTGTFLNITGVNGTSTDSTIFIELDRPIGEPSCASGALAPLRFIVYPTDTAPYPIPTSSDCIGTGPICLTTGMAPIPPRTAFVADAFGRVQLPGVRGGVQVMDPMGRIVHYLGSTGANGWLDLNGLGAGLYLMRYANASGKRTVRVLVDQ